MSAIVVSTTEPNYNYHVPTTAVDIDDINQAVEYESNYVPSHDNDVPYYLSTSGSGTGRSILSVSFDSDSDGNDTAGNAGTIDKYVINYSYDDIDDGTIQTSTDKSTDFSVSMSGDSVQIYSITADLEISINTPPATVVKSIVLVLTNSSGSDHTISWASPIDSTCWTGGVELSTIPNGKTYMVQAFSYGNTIPDNLSLTPIQKGS